MKARAVLSATCLTNTHATLESMSEYTLFPVRKEVESKVMAGSMAQLGHAGGQDSRCPDAFNR